MAISCARRKLCSRSLVRSDCWLAPNNRIELQLNFHIGDGRLGLGWVPPRVVRLTTTNTTDRKREVGDADERKSVRFQNREEISFYVSLSRKKLPLRMNEDEMICLYNRQQVRRCTT